MDRRNLASGEREDLYMSEKSILEFEEEEGGGSGFDEGLADGAADEEGEAGGMRGESRDEEAGAVRFI